MLRLFVAAVCVALCASRAEAGMLVDHISNTGNWQGGVGGYSYWSGGIVDANTVAAFRGDGGKIDKIGVLFGVFDRFNVPNAIAPTPLDWAVTFYTSFGDFSSNPFLVNDTLPQTKVFNLPSNPDWLTVVGQTGASATIPGTGVQLRYAEFHVSSENWVTTSGALQGVAVLPFNHPLGNTGIAHSNGTSAIGMELDWYIIKNSSNTWGPSSLQDVGFARPYAAYMVQTVSVPEPSALMLVGTGVVGTWLLLRRQRR